MSADPQLRVHRMSDVAVVERDAGVRSVQQAQLSLPAAALERSWTRPGLECLARRYWLALDRHTHGLLRVVHRDDRPTVTLARLPPALMRLHPPAYALAADVAEVAWRISGGLLVASTGRDTGLLRIEVRRSGMSADQDEAVLTITIEVDDFHPRLRGSGWFARTGIWLYRSTQLRLHVWQARRFLGSLGHWYSRP